ncbi:MAG TPA: DUF6502 family protein, partial [Steroidobacteraceae bacterium]
TTDARIAIVAGLPKSDVRALRDALRAGAPHSMRATVSLDQITSLLTVWHTHSNFSGAYGLAMDMDLQFVSGSPRRTFRELVEESCPGADSEALLDELVAANSVEILDGNTVRCLSRAYVPQAADVTRIDRMGRFLGLVTSSFVHNLLRNDNDPDPIYLERTVVSDEPLTAAARDEFLNLASDKGQELLVELDTALTHLTETARNPAGKKYGLGIYVFEDAANSVYEKLVPIQRNQNATGSKPGPVEEIDVLAVARRKD